MSDSPENSTTQGQGWHQPTTPGTWHTPTPTVKPADSGGWRRPTMPTDVHPPPASEGACHLPKPEDTPADPPPEEALTTTAAPAPEDVAPSATPRPEDFMPADEAVAPEDAPMRPEDAIFGATQRPAPEDTAAPAPEDLTLETDDADDFGADLEDALDDMDDAYAIAAQTLEELEDDEDDTDAFQMSELMALQSLADATPEGAVQQGTAAGTPEVEEEDATDGLDTSGLSPAELAMLESAARATDETTATDNYMAEQLARLQAEQGLGSTDPMAGAMDRLEEEGDFGQGTGDEHDPAAAARAALEELQGATGQYAPFGIDDTTGGESTAALDPAQMELARQFSEAETNIRALRDQYNQGLMNQEQFEQQLRQHMVLDNEQVWWMMGAQTDMWYRYNQGNGQWEVAQPPRLDSPQRQGVPTETSPYDAQEFFSEQGSLPYLGDDGGEYSGQLQNQQTQPSGFSTGDPYNTDYVRPAQADTYDPNQTVVGGSAVDLDQTLRNDAQTIPGSSYFEPTVQSPAVGGDYVAPDAQDDFEAAVQAPIGEGVEGAPAYDTDDEYGEAVRRAQERQQRTAMGQLIAAVVVILGIALLGVAGAALGIGLWWSDIAERWRDEVTGLAAYEPPFSSVFIYDVNGEQIAEINSQAADSGARVPISLNEVSPLMIHAVVSLENERFFIDPGYDPIAITRAFIQNFTQGQVVSGGSTITQQIVRNLIFGNSDEFAALQLNEADRKLNEIVAAGMVSQQYTKEEILELYLNEVYFGNLAYGIEAAARFYFDKSASDLNLAESALLAGLIQAPATYDPVQNRETAFDRMDVVFQRMVAVGCLDIPFQANPVCVTNDTVRQAAVERAEVETAQYLPRENTSRYPHFEQFVRARLERSFSQGEIFGRGFNVYTTLNPRIQDFAEAALNEQINLLRDTGINTGTIMVTDPRTGAIRAMIGSPDFNNEEIDGQLNLALAYRQPGSSIKPIVYATALQGVQVEGSPQYYTPATILWDIPANYPDGTSIVNFDGRFRGPVNLRAALQNSYNIPAVQTYNFIGNDRFRQTAEGMGLTFADNATFGLPTALGATEVRLFDMMVAYGTIANDGNRVPLFAIERIEDAAGNPVEIAERPAPTQAIRPSLAFLLQNILADDGSRAPAFGASPTLLTLAQYNGAVGAKTGTSSEARDLWTVGFTNTAVVGVRLNNAGNQQTFGTSGYVSAAPLWQRVMEVAVQGTNVQPFENPGGVVARPVCRTTGTQPGNNCPNAGNEFFIENQPPPPPAQGFVQTLNIDTWTGLIANDLCSNNVVQGTFLALNYGSFNPFIENWLNSTQQGRAYANSIGLPLPANAPPTQSCDINAPILQAAITAPANGANVITETVDIQGSVTASNFQEYTVAVANANAPNNFTVVAGPFNSPVTSGTLGTWDATNFTNGQYLIQLRAVSNSGGFATRQTQITLNKPLPTPTPVPTIVPTVPSFENATPLPFDSIGNNNNFGTFNSQGAFEGPTPTFDFGG